MLTDLIDTAEKADQMLEDTIDMLEAAQKNAKAAAMCSFQAHQIVYRELQKLKADYENNKS